MNKTPSFFGRYKIYIIIALIVVALIGYSMYKKANVLPNYAMDTVKLDTISDTVSESGNLITDGQANIVAPIDGVINNIFVTDGQTVGKGQALFSISSLATDQDKALAYANLLAAQNGVATADQTQLSLGGALDTAKQQVYTAQNNYNIVSKGYHKGSTNPTTGNIYKYLELESADAALDAAKTNLAAAQQKYNDAGLTISSAQATADSAQLAYDGKSNLTVKAPTSGMVSNLGFSIGDKVSATGVSGTTISPVLIISKSSTLVFKTQINEIDIPKLKLYAAATITIDAIKGKTFDGKITKIDQIGTNTSGVISYGVYFSINNPDQGLRGAMSGNVDIETEKHENVLTVANSAIKPYQNGKAVQILPPAGSKSKTLVYVPVQVGLKGTDRTEITNGLTEGQQVILTTQPKSTNPLTGATTN